KELEYDYGHARRLAQFNYTMYIATLWSAMIGSAIAGSAGLLDAEISKQTIGFFALVPVASAVLERTMRFQWKASYNYRWMYKCFELIRRLRYELPPCPSIDEVATVSRAYNTMNSELHELWQSEMGTSARTDAAIGMQQ